MGKLRFEFMVNASEDPKCYSICINSITDGIKNTYSIPEHLQSTKFHDEFMKFELSENENSSKNETW